MSQNYNQALPVFKHKEQILKSIADHDIVLIVGHTGSGKTTQIPQYLLDSPQLNRNKQIICTQPRRIAVTSVTRRVVEEQQRFQNRIFEHVGDRVGFKIRFNDKTSDCTKLIFMTEGILLRIATANGSLQDQTRNLSHYSIIMIDEAHERSVDCDILMAFLKTQQKRLDFKLIIMSATLDQEKFQNYFESPFTIQIDGIMNPIDHFWLKTPTIDYIETSATAVVSIFLDICKQSIHDNSNENHVIGDILVFMPGKKDIYTVNRIINKKLSQYYNQNHEIFNGRTLEIHLLYRNLDDKAQRQAVAINTNATTTTKCIISTNIAETSLTIDGIVYVIDCGLAKMTNIDPTTGIQSLTVQAISKSSVKQRQGRCGRTRTRHGKIYHLYTTNGYKELSNETTPAILRSNLIKETLQMLSIGIDNICTFDYIDAPNEMVLARALTKLKHLKCIDNNGKITDLGYQIDQFPCSPSMAMAIITSVDKNCLSQLLRIAAMIEVLDGLWKLPEHKQVQKYGNKGNKSEMKTADPITLSLLKQAKKKLRDTNGDHCTLLNVYDKYMNIRRNEQEHFCHKYCLNKSKLNSAKHIVNQLKFKVGEILGVYKWQDNDLESPSYYDNIMISLLSGYFANVAYLCPETGKYIIFETVELDDCNSCISCIDSTEIEHESSLAYSTKSKTHLKPNWVMFDTVEQNDTNIQLRCVSKIKLSWLLDAAPHCFDLNKLKGDKSFIKECLHEVSQT